MRKVLLGLGALIVIVVVGLFIWHQQMKVRYEADRAKLEWQAAKLAQEVASHGAVPKDWDAGIFIGNQALKQVTDQLKGLKLALVGDDIKVEITGVDLHSDATFLSLTLSLAAKSEKRDADLALEAEAQLAYVGSVEVGGHREAQFRVVPITIDPKIGWLDFNFHGGRFASDLLVSGLLSAMLEAKPLAIPFQDRLEKDIGMSQRKKLTGKDMPGWVLVEYTVPKSVLSWKVTALAPLILKDGMWLLARGAGSELSATPDPGAMKKADMEAETKIIRAEIAKIATPAHGAEVWMSAAPILDLVRQFNELPPVQRTIHVKTVEREGQLYKTSKDIDIIGKAEFYVELAGDGASGDATIGPIASSFSANHGLAIDLPVGATADASVHVHGDPGIGGGAGTTVGMKGGGSGAGAGAINFRHAVLGDAPVLAAVADYECRNMSVEAKTDGKLKLDFGWTVMPSVGMRKTMLIDLSSLKPTILLDGLPMAVAGRGSDGKPVVIDQGGHKVIVEPTWEALGISVLSGDAQATDRGWIIDVDLAVAPMAAVTDAWKEQQSARRKELGDLALKQWPIKECPEPDGWEVLLGDLEIGDQNEIVKVLVWLGKLPGEALEEAKRIGKELSADKVQEWKDNPEKSFKKSDLGKAADGLLKLPPPPPLPKLPDVKIKW